MIELNKIYSGDVIANLKAMPDSFIDCCVTSPPYFGLRDYGHEGQIGLEETPELFVSKLVDVFTEVRRVLKKDGTLWMNLGDSYAGPAKNGSASNAKSTLQGGKATQTAAASVKMKVRHGVKDKDLIGVPWMVAFALRSSGWYLRQDIIWHKPNPMPESVTDRCTKSHEYIFLLSKSSKYYYNHEAIKQVMADSSFQRLSQDVESQEGSDRVPGKSNGKMKAVGCGDANKRSVWTVTTKPYKEAHFATFPQELIVDMIKAGCPEDGIVLDPFMGAGTTAVVAGKLGRKYIGIELNPKYIQIAEKRIYSELGLFKTA